MEIIHLLFGQGKELNALQMSMRAALIFVITLILIRFSGRRSFGMRMPFDNIITILLGAILSRAVTGSSPFIPVVIASAVIVIIHRLIALWRLHSEWVSYLISGKPKLLFENENLNIQNMNDSLLTEKDMLQELRINANINSLHKISEAYCENNGEVSIVKKDE